MALLCFGALGVLVSCGERAAESPAVIPARPVSLAEVRDQVLGHAAAPLDIRALLPLGTGCQDGIGLYLVDLAGRRPDLFRVQIHDMQSETGHAVMAAQGIRCAAVIVNGTTRFDLGEDSGGKILLEGPMDPLDLYEVLRVQLRSVADASGFTLPEPDVRDAPSPEKRRAAGFDAPTPETPREGGS